MIFHEKKPGRLYLKARCNTSGFAYKIIVLSLFLLIPFSIRCSNPLKEPFKNLTGHWISSDAQRHYYFSRKRRLIIIDESEGRLADTEFFIGVVDSRVENKVKKRIYLYFPIDIFGHEDCWLNFSDDKKHINTTAFGILNYVDERQKP